MAVYDRLSGDKKFPPESRKARRQLQFGRYDFCMEDSSSSSSSSSNGGAATGEGQPKRSAAEVDAIVERLRQNLRRDEAKSLPGGGHQHRTVSEGEAKEIFDRLTKCDYSRWPVESRVGRRELGQNRYDFYRGREGEGEASPRVSKAELDTIVGRLSTYDVAKTPPGSRALEIKQWKAANGAQ